MQLYFLQRVQSNYLSHTKSQKLLKLIQENLVLSSHDVSSGGLITAISEMTFSSEIGAKILKPKKLANFINYLFGEKSAYGDDYRRKVEDLKMISAIGVTLKCTVFFVPLGTVFHAVWRMHFMVHVFTTFMLNAFLFMNFGILVWRVCFLLSYKICFYFS